MTKIDDLLKMEKLVNLIKIDAKSNIDKKVVISRIRSYEETKNLTDLELDELVNYVYSLKTTKDAIIEDELTLSQTEELTNDLEFLLEKKEQMFQQETDEKTRVKLMEDMIKLRGRIIKLKERQQTTSTSSPKSSHNPKTKPFIQLPLSEDELKCLKDADLLYNILVEARNVGIIANEEVVLTTTIIMMVRNLSNFQAVSSNLVYSDEPTSGKDYISQLLADVLLWDDPRYMNIGATSPTMFNYAAPPVGDTWTGIVCRIEDVQVDLLKTDNFKKMGTNPPYAARPTEVHVTKDQELYKNTIRGKPTLICTSATQSFNSEGDTRWNIERIDTSDETTRAMIDWKSKLAEMPLAERKKLKLEPNYVLRNALTKMPKCSVIIPYMTKVTKSSSAKLCMRRFHPALIDFISASACLFQFQRQRTVDNEVIADIQDLQIGLYLYNRFNQDDGLALNVKEKKIFDEIKKYDSDYGITAKTLMELTGMSKTMIYETLENLMDKQIVTIKYVNQKIDEYKSITVKCYKLHSTSAQLLLNLEKMFPDDSKINFLRDLQDRINHDRLKIFNLSKPVDFTLYFLKSLQEPVITTVKPETTEQPTEQPIVEKKKPRKKKTDDENSDGTVFGIHIKSTEEIEENKRRKQEEVD